ncbi:MAG: site-specific integrase [Oligoflexia bacterium]|nr:site-specific integrase [Oligoflexia bacterium]
MNDGTRIESAMGSADVVPTKSDFLAFQDDFFKSLERAQKSVNTIKNYRTDLNCFNNFLNEKSKDMVVQEFNPTNVEEYASYLDGKYPSSNSRRRRVQTLRIFFDFLLNREVFRENPIKKITPSPKFLDIPRPTSMNHIITLWDHLFKEGQTSDLFQSLLSYRNMVIFLLVYGGGLKVSELSSLKKEHLFLGKNPRVMIIPPKRDPYTIPLHPLFTNVHEKYIKLFSRVQKETNSNNFYDRFDQEFKEVLFNANHYRILAGGISPRGLEIIFEELRKKLKIELTPKSLRQSCIFKWIHQKLPESQIKEWMGVAPSYSLKTYYELSENHIFHENFMDQVSIS